MPLLSEAKLFFEQLTEWTSHDHNPELTINKVIYTIFLKVILILLEALHNLDIGYRLYIHPFMNF